MKTNKTDQSSCDKNTETADVGGAVSPSSGCVRGAVPVIPGSHRFPPGIWWEHLLRTRRCTPDGHRLFPSSTVWQQRPSWIPAVCPCTAPSTGWQWRECKPSQKCQQPTRGNWAWPYLKGKNKVIAGNDGYKNGSWIYCRSVMLWAIISQIK